MPKSSASEISNKPSMRLLSDPAGGTTSSPKAKIPGLEGASSTLKLDSQRNQLVHCRRRWSKFAVTPCLDNELSTNCEMFSITRSLNHFWLEVAFPTGQNSARGTVAAIEFEERAGSPRPQAASHFCYELRSFRAAITASGIATLLLYVVPVNN